MGDTPASPINGPASFTATFAFENPGVDTVTVCGHVTTNEIITRSLTIDGNTQTTVNTVTIVNAVSDSVLTS